MTTLYSRLSNYFKNAYFRVSRLSHIKMVYFLRNPSKISCLALELLEINAIVFDQRE